MRLLKLGGNTQELLNVLGATLRLHRSLSAKRLQKPGLVNNHLDNVLELALHTAPLTHNRDERGQTVAHLGAEHARLRARDLARLEKRTAVLPRKHLDLLNRRRPDTATRCVDHALDAHLVRRVHDHLEIRHDIANLGAIEEARAAHDLVRHARAQEHIFERARLRVSAVKHGDIIVTHALDVQFFNLARNPATLVTLVRRLIRLDFLAIARGGEQLFLLTLRVMTHHGVGGVQNMPGRTIILLELDRFARGEILLEIEDVGDIGTAPAVNGLIVIADNHKILVLGSKQIGDLVLYVVGVLILVHADVAKALLVLFENVRMVAEQLERTDEQIVEVHGVGGAQSALQLQIHLRRLFIVRTVGALEHVLRPDHRVFGRRNLASDHVDRELLLLDAERLHDVAHEALGIVIIVDSELSGIAEQVGILAKHAHAHRVERADPHAACARRNQRRQTVAHLGGRLVGERDGKNLPGLNTQVTQHMCDAER